MATNMGSLASTTLFEGPVLTCDLNSNDPIAPCTLRHGFHSPLVSYSYPPKPSQHVRGTKHDGVLSIDELTNNTAAGTIRSRPGTMRGPRDVSIATESVRRTIRYDNDPATHLGTYTYGTSGQQEVPERSVRATRDLRVFSCIYIIIQFAGWAGDWGSS